MAELEARHLADLRFSDVTRALRALSSAYVERRESALADHKALDGAGKRAAFAMYYGPLHFLLVEHIVRELGVVFDPGVVVDLGCGTGVAGAAIALRAAAMGRDLRVLGVDTHPWTLDEARFTYKTMDLKADVRRVHAAKMHFPADTSVVVAAFVVNELTDKDRNHVLEQILAGARFPAPGSRPPAPRSRFLIIEPISQRISPWWHEWAAAFQKIGGRADTWKARVDMPPLVKRLAKAAGLRPEMLTARSLFL
jgi:ubiquinone/menaquinone biosynthesis C-methylase UbiE